MISQYSKNFLILFISLSSCVWANDTYELIGRSANFLINPKTLSITAITKSKQKLNLVQPLKASPVVILQVSNNAISWYYPSLAITVNVNVDDLGLNFKFTTKKEQTLKWPNAGTDASAIAIVIPAGEGLYIPNTDKFWIQQFKRSPSINLTIPFWSIQYANQYVSYLFPENQYLNYNLKEQAGKLTINTSYTFVKQNNYKPYTVLIHFSGITPTSSALDYRNYLIKNKKFVSLDEKIKDNPNVKKLLGAFHVWLWGDGKSIAMLKLLQQLGIDKIWLGYDPSPQPKNNVNKEFVLKAESIGYLIGPYDSYDNGQRPETADQITSKWNNNLYPDACIQKVNGKLLTGFAGRGCYLSSEAFRLRESSEHNIARRVDLLTQNGVNSYFIDVDAAPPLYTDYAKTHPMSEDQDLDNRLARMYYVSKKRRLVLGSETGLSWANQVIAYNNGAFTSFSEAFWPVLSDKRNFGTWRSSNTPTVFFKPYKVQNTTFFTASYAPQYRIPLYETVFHDSVVSTDRWELHTLKIPAITKNKELLETLYNVPAIWDLDLNTLKQNAAHFSKYYAFFSPIHRVSGNLPLISFKWLDKSRLVQQTQYGEEIKITANFSMIPYNNIQSQCVQVMWLKLNQINNYCP